MLASEEGPIYTLRAHLVSEQAGNPNMAFNTAPAGPQLISTVFLQGTRAHPVLLAPTTVCRFPCPPRACRPASTV
jgi:hypothetical protein